MSATATETTYSTRTCEVDLGDLLKEAGTLDQFLDYIATLAHGSDLLMDITWKAVAFDPANQSLTLEVTGDRSLIDDE